MGLSQISQQYSVPAKRGRRVLYSGGDRPKLGTICGASGASLTIRLDGETVSRRYHPTWNILYLDAADQRDSHPGTS